VLRPEFRGQLEFVEQDLRAALPAERFHLVLCRNLAFTYFDEALQRSTLGGIAARLLPGGALVIGSQESLPAGAHEFLPSRPNRGVFRLASLGA
jgi:chemotaxis protein methyltransferase CheR